jgi:hypothetical protein
MLMSRTHFAASPGRHTSHRTAIEFHQGHRCKINILDAADIDIGHRRIGRAAILGKSMNAAGPAEFMRDDMIVEAELPSPYSGAVTVSEASGTHQR